MWSLLQNISPVEPTPEMNQQGAGNSQEIMMAATPQNVFPIVATPGPGQQMPGNYPIHTDFGNVVGQPSNSSFPSPGMNQPWAEVPALEMNQQGAGNFAVNTDFGTMLGQPSASLLPTPGINQRRAGKRPINPNFDNTLARPTAASLLIGERPRIPYVERNSSGRLLDADNRARLMPPSSNAG